jgi:hypothetical protein
VGVPGRARAARSVRTVACRIAAEIRDGLPEPGERPGHTGHDEQHGRQAGSGAQPPDPPAPAKIRAEPLSDVSGDIAHPRGDVSGDVAQRDGRWLKIMPHGGDHGQHGGERCRPPADSRDGLAGSNLRADPVEPVAGWLDRVGGEPERVAQGPLKHGPAWFGAPVAHVSRSSTERSAPSARDVWLLTAPLVIPIAEAIWASDMSA